MRSHLLAWPTALRDRLLAWPSTLKDHLRSLSVTELRRKIRDTSPLGWLYFASCVLVIGVFLAYFSSWWSGYAPALLDTNLQTDDARTALFPFHRYAPGAPLANDPIANEMIEYQPYAFRLIYRIGVPLKGLLWAAKLAQFVCLSIVAYAAWVMLRSRRAGLGPALLFLFAFLHDNFVMNRIGGGLPRSFGFPAMSVWLAGVLAHNLRARRAGAIIAAFTYPSALAMILAAEGMYTLRGLARPGWRTTWRRLRHYLLLVAACAALFAPTALLGASDGGPVHTLAQAEQEPAFSKAGRLWLLPLPNAGAVFGEHLTQTFEPLGESPVSSLRDALDPRHHEVALVMVGITLLLPLLGMAQAPLGVLAFAGSAFLMYALSIVFAFRLYSPERYYSFGMHVVGLGLFVNALGLTLPRLQPRIRRLVRNCVVALTIFLVWGGLGDGLAPRGRMAMTIDYRRRAPLWEFIRTLPKDVRIASFISDGDDIPLFAQRANNGGFETLQPWLTLSWARQKARAEDTLRAFYATDHETVLSYARKYRVSHLLVNRSRYRGDIIRQSRSFEPLTTFARELLERADLNGLVLANIPAPAIIYSHGNLDLVDVEKLQRAWDN
ncbi:MAG TPA: hypothetical protein VFQ61_10955 [Polyangiaceae bacterium]|nr:hypothetical protein [Polyangiaceae bacterium]